MSDRAIELLVRDYLALIREGLPTRARNESELSRLLDDLAARQHDVTVAFDDGDDPDPPDWPYAERRALAQERFPGYGYYNLVSPVAEKVGEAEVVVGDAIDDIADIAGDLAVVEWCWSHTTRADALWNFEFSYRTHWGQHLRALQLYLHSLRDGG